MGGAGSEEQDAALFTRPTDRSGLEGGGTKVLTARAEARTDRRLLRQDVCRGTQVAWLPTPQQHPGLWQD